MIKDKEEILAIVPDEKNYYQTNIVEKDKEYSVSQLAYEIMDNVCLYYGSSYEGREKGSKNALGDSYKLPIIVNNSNHLIFFPTKSKKNHDCSWISLHAIDHFESKGKRSIVYLKNGKNLVVSVSYSSLKTQIMKASRLETILIDRI